MERVSEEWQTRAKHMPAFCIKVPAYADGLEQDKFVTNQIVYDAILHNLALIGEALLRDRDCDPPCEVCERGERQPEAHSAGGVNAQAGEVIQRRKQNPRPPDPHRLWRRFHPGGLSR